MMQNKQMYEKGLELYYLTGSQTATCIKVLLLSTELHQKLYNTVFRLEFGSIAI